ncbi:MAG: tRNA (N6-isopentenyl adenosine(37)-C2)-methylthiotransferase MiaB [Parcubacteria group bacterium]|nr:tRNA (N6-isopentenyl adenosine(37)-C2)-methylthiotransferase MiaB [Parcubacteria group bacterium]
MQSKTYHIITHGCQMNVNDSERVASLLESIGMREAQRTEDADVVVINTCSVRQSAEDRVFGRVANMRRLKEKRPHLRIAVTGCMPGRDLDGRLQRKLAADFFFPIRDLPHFPYTLAESWASEIPQYTPPVDYLDITPKYRSRVQAYITIQSGCNNFCTFCVVPYSRGREQSRPVHAILREISECQDHGVIEVTLLGQNVNTYRPPDRETFSKKNPFTDPFAALLWETNQIPGIERIHFTAPNPQDMTDQVIEALGLPKHVNYLHLPVQAGNEEILRRMNRRYSRERYLSIIEKVRRVRPTIALGTDIIVGFCGETREQFEDTLSLYRTVGFDIAYIAQYSPRTHTLAAKLWRDDIPREEKKARWIMLQHLMESIVREKNKAYEHSSVEVLIDEVENATTAPIPQGHRANVLLSGNSREMKRVKFFGPKNLVGSVTSVRILKSQEWILWGEPIV